MRGLYPAGFKDRTEIIRSGMFTRPCMVIIMHNGIKEGITEVSPEVVKALWRFIIYYTAVILNAVISSRQIDRLFKILGGQEPAIRSPAFAVPACRLHGKTWPA